jgi:hypothetical protein
MADCFSVFEYAKNILHQPRKQAQEVLIQLESTAHDTTKLAMLTVVKFKCSYSNL